MNFFSEKDIRKSVFASLISLVSLLSIVFAVIYVADQFNSLEKDLPEIEREFINQQKNLLKYAVNLKIREIDFRMNHIKHYLEENLSSRVFEAKNICESLFFENIDTMSKELLEKLTIQALRSIRFNEDRGYFFIIGMDGVIQLYPPDPSLEGYPFNTVLDAKEQNIVNNLIAIAKKDDSGFFEYDWPVPHGFSKTMYKKLSFIAHSKPYDWIIGTGEYYEDFGAMTRDSILEDIKKTIGTSSENYIFIYQLHNIKGGRDFATMLLNPNRPDLEGRKISDNIKGAKGNEFRKEFLEGLRQKGEAFVSYWYKKPGHRDPSPKLSYFKLYPEWNWVVAQGVYLDELDAILFDKKQKLHMNVKKRLITFAMISLIFISIFIGLAYIFTRNINALFERYRSVQKKQHSELERLNKHLNKQATTDTLTGLFNRNYFNVHLSREIHRAHRYHHSLSLILFDIDHFKQVNDTFGHLAGDSVLKELSDLIGSLIRKSDVLSRWGGEEFVILLLEANRDESRIIAEKLCTATGLHQYSINQKITCSFGVTTYIPGENMADFINRADQGLYEAKNAGRNRVALK